MPVLLLLGITACRESPPPEPVVAPVLELVSETNGDRLVRAGRYREAVEAYRRAVSRKPDSADLYRKLAEACVKNENLPQAVDAYERAIVLQPDHAKARTELAILFT
ncbi:MAG: tetratricopeptide repeat protein, partial [Gemmatimonadetes bacterium]|nr:tetratricopeptide repeat protein [Gemmatimonadota bacterium]